MDKHILIPAFTIFLFACSADTKNQKGGIVSPYYNLEQLANSQASLLLKDQPTVNKVVIVNGKSEKTSLTISNWEKELGVLKKSNIDKPAYLGEYAIDTITKSNGLPTKTFTSLKENLSVKFQQIQFDTLGNPIRIESASEDKNFLYYTKKEIVAELETKSGETKLKTYAVNIIQKIICLDTFKMKVEAKIN